jgi:MFS family permease
LVLQAVIIAAYVLARESWSFYALAVVFGTAYGGVMPLYALVTREYFGEKVMGTAYGAVFLVSSLGMGVGSLAGGVIYDRLGAYAWLYLGSALVAFAAVGLAFTFRRPASLGTGIPSAVCAR